VMPRVSVVMPVCNGEGLIRTSLRSVLEQTYKDLEVIIVDDASGDRTVKTVQRLARSHRPERIRLIRLRRRLGTCAARNIACKEAEGDYLAFLDQDDRWIPGKLELQTRYLDQHGECAMVFGDLDTRDSLGYRLDFTACQHSKHSPSWDDILTLHPIYPSASLVRKDTFWEVGGFDSSFTMSGAYGDQELNLRIREESPIIFMDRILGSYRWDIERPTRIESFLVNLPTYARVCWDRKELTPLRSPDLQRKFVRLCHAQYVYYANLLLANCYAQLSDRQLGIIAYPRSEFFGIFPDLYPELTEMRPLRLSENVDSPLMRVLVAILLLRPDLQRQYPEALNGDLGRLRAWADASYLLDDYGSILSFFKRNRIANSVQSVSSQHLETWLHRPDWNLVNDMVGPEVDIIRDPDNPSAALAAEPPAFPEPKNPVEISIIIPSHNKTAYLMNCLKSVAANTTSFGNHYEVIVIDNGSTESAFQIISTITNLHLVKLQHNKGFIDACNAGAREARGKYLVFLNNDTIVTPGWLEALMHAIKADPKVGAVGAKLVYPSGLLQEAGCITWNNGMCHNYGRGDDPNKPEYSYRREVDYCSGACLLLSSELFERVGRFDRQYSPAYYEDTDLCFNIRKRGKRVIYQPNSVVIHFEGVTGGRDIRSGFKRYQRVNHEKFAKKWAAELKTQPPPGKVLTGRDRLGHDAVLVVERRIPEPNKNSGDNRLDSIIQMLRSNDFQVTVLADDHLRRDPYVAYFQDHGVEIVFEQTLEGLLKSRPDFYGIIWLSRVETAFKHLTLARALCPNAQLVFDMVDLVSLREHRLATLTHDGSLLAVSEGTRSKELYVARRSDLTIAISEREKFVLLQEDPSLQVEVLPNVHIARQPRKSFKTRKDLLFLGGFEHPPNVDGVLYFLDEIFDEIRARLPDLHLTVVGSDMPDKIRNLKHDGLKIVGYSENLEPLFDSSRVFVAPIRYGAGIKGKIGLSMAWGLPVVTTSMGAEGMGLEHERNVLISDDPHEFADYVVKLYTSPQLWHRLSMNGQLHVKERYGQKKVERMLSRILRRLSYARYEGLRGETSPTLLQELTRTRQELASTKAELETIRRSHIFSILRYLTNHIDAAFPEGTTRGRFRKTAIASLSILRNEGWRSFLWYAKTKIRRGEFTVRS
jgi:GT2 family glycosyltransferase